MFISAIGSKIQNAFQQVIQHIPSSRVLKTAAAAALAFGTIDHFMNGQRIKDCLSPNCPDINISRVHPKEKEAVYVLNKVNSVFKPIFEATYAINRIKDGIFKMVTQKNPERAEIEMSDSDLTYGQEFLRFNSNDPRKKLLIATAEHDHNGALEPWGVSHLFEAFDEPYDTRYQIVRSFAELCEAIKEGAKTGDLEKIVIDAHGDMYLIGLSSLFRSAWIPFLDYGIYFFSDFADCFSPLPPNAKIYLLSCSTGKPKKNFFEIAIEKITGWEQKGDPFNNIAQAMADTGKRVVYAPTDLTTSETIYSPENQVFKLPKDFYIKNKEGEFIFSNPLKWLYGENLYQAFHPRTKKCSPYVNRFMLTEYELATESAIKADLIARSLLHKDSPFLEKYFQNCEDDQRKKVAVVSINEPWPAIDNIKLFRELINNFDFRFKQAWNFYDVCDAAFEAAKQGEVAAIIIQVAKSSNGILFPKDSNGKEDQIDLSKDFRSCFSELSKDAKIIFMGGSLGSDSVDEPRIPQKIADETQRVVDASVCTIFAKKVEIQSMEPLTLHHSSHMYLENWARGCKGDNLFKSFYPQN